MITIQNAAELSRIDGLGKNEISSANLENYNEQRIQWRDNKKCIAFFSQ